jgi:glycosyltransferase involved in cell wall biosynthesis
MTQAEKSAESQLDKYTGLYIGSHGGTELMYRQLTSRLGPKYMDRFQIICSRFREFEPGKLPILWMHDLARDAEAKRLQDPAFRQQFKKIVFVSYFQFNQFHTIHGVPFSCSQIIKNAIDPLPACQKPTDRINLIYHTTPHRGLGILVPVFVALAEEFPHIHLDVFSSFKVYGWEHRDKPYEPLYEICRNHPQITYHGYQPNEVVREALLKAHIFAYPCVWRETSCIAAMEAISAGALVVCPNLGVLPETVGDYGVIYHFNEDPTAHAQVFHAVLRTLIERFKTNSLLPAVQAAKGRADAAFGWQGRLPEWIHMLDHVS